MPNIKFPEITVPEGVETPQIVLPSSPSGTSALNNDFIIDDTTPLEIYQAKKNQPYAVDLFEAGELYNANADQFQEKLFYLDNWVKERIFKDNMRANVASYKNILQTIFVDLGINNDPDFIKINKLYNFLRTVR